MVSGFETYLTGYPLLETPYYVLARTWYAPEMDRPGCVYTHSLLIEHADLARITDLDILDTLFARPPKLLRNRALGHYKVPLLVSPDALTPAANAVNSQPDGLAQAVLGSLYGQPRRPIYLLTDCPSVHEKLFLAVWTQQWPRLRRSLRFCTGAINNRSLDRVPFDLQIVPNAYRHQLSRDVADAYLTDQWHEQPPWLMGSLADLDTPGRLRQFLWDFAADVPASRGAFSQLSEVLLLMDEIKERRSPPIRLVEVLCDHFPTPDVAMRLKQTLLGESGNVHLGIGEAELLKVLGSVPLRGALQGESLEVGRRAANLWRTEQTAAQDLLFALASGESTPIGESILGALGIAMTSQEAVEVGRARPNLRGALVSWNPLLAIDPQIWSVPPGVQWEIWRSTLPAVMQDAQLAQRVIHAMLEAQVDAIAPFVLLQIGSQAVNSVLDWIEEKAEPTKTWQDALASHPDALIGWLQAHPTPRMASVSLIARLVGPHHPAARSVSIDRWHELFLHVGTSANLSRASLPPELYAFLLSLGLLGEDASAQRAVYETFGTVHEALAQDWLPYPAWPWLEPLVPSLGARNWDKCERIRQALVRKAVSAGWSLLNIHDSVDEDTWWRLWRFANKLPGGTAIFAR